MNHANAEEIAKSLELTRRLETARADEADAIGEVAQTRHQILSPVDDDAAAAMWRTARAAARASPPRLKRLRFVTITTDSPGSFAAWVGSLRAALDDASWRSGRAPQIEVLRIANDADASIDAAHRAVSAEGITIHVVGTNAACRPLPLAAARPFAFRCLRARMGAVARRAGLVTRRGLPF